MGLACLVVLMSALKSVSLIIKAHGRGTEPINCHELPHLCGFASIITWPLCDGKFVGDPSFWVGVWCHGGEIAPLTRKKGLD